SRRGRLKPRRALVRGCGAGFHGDLRVDSDVARRPGRWNRKSGVGVEEHRVNVPVSWIGPAVPSFLVGEVDVEGPPRTAPRPDPRSRSPRHLVRARVWVRSEHVAVPDPRVRTGP